MNIVLDVPSTRFLVSANRRIHWSERARLQKYWRQRACGAARRLKPAQLDRAHIVVTVRYPDKRRRDVANLHALLAKPLVDGVVDAGLLADDDDTHLIGPDLRRDPDNGPLRVTIEITEVPHA